RRARTRLSAALRPAGPAPTMTTSYSASTVPVMAVLSSQPLSETLHAGDRRILAEQLHRLEQGRADAAAGQRGAQRAEGQPRLEAEPVDQGCAQGRFDRLVSPVGDIPQGSNGCGKHLPALVTWHRVSIEFDAVVVGEQERQQAWRLAQQLHAFLHEGGRLGEQYTVLTAVDDTSEIGQQPLSEIVRFEHPDVVAVDRLGLLLVEAGRVRVDVFHV